jgi:hypothetical protein
MQSLELVIAAICVLLALSTRPWRMLTGESGHALLTPLLATLVVLPWLWAMQACMRFFAASVVWCVDRAVDVGMAAGRAFAAAGWLHRDADFAMSFDAALTMAVWQGVVPRLPRGRSGRRLAAVGRHAPVCLHLGPGFSGHCCLPVFVQFAIAVGGAPFAGCAGRTFVGGALAHRLERRLCVGYALRHFVAFRPEWLATWSDRLYLKPK